MKIQLTLRDVQLGVIGECGHCPVARALERETGKHCRVFDGVAHIDLVCIVLPPEVVEWLRRFDASESVVPISFVIPYGSMPWMSTDEVTDVLQNIAAGPEYLAGYKGESFEPEALGDMKYSQHCGVDIFSKATGQFVQMSIPVMNPLEALKNKEAIFNIDEAKMTRELQERKELACRE